MRASSCSTCTVPLAAELAGKLPATCSPVGAGAGGGASNADMADVNISIESATRGELGSGAAVAYTQLTLPTNRDGDDQVRRVSVKRKKHT